MVLAEEVFYRAYDFAAAFRSRLSSRRHATLVQNAPHATRTRDREVMRVVGGENEGEEERSKITFMNGR